MNQTETRQVLRDFSLILKNPATSPRKTAAGLRPTSHRPNHFPFLPNAIPSRCRFRRVLADSTGRSFCTLYNGRVRSIQTTFCDPAIARPRPVRHTSGKQVARNRSGRSRRGAVRLGRRCVPCFTSQSALRLCLTWHCRKTRGTQPTSSSSSVAWLHVSGFPEPAAS